MEFRCIAAIRWTAVIRCIAIIRYTAVRCPAVIRYTVDIHCPDFINLIPPQRPVRRPDVPNYVVGDEKLLT